MKIELRKVTVGEVVENYTDSNEEGVVGYDGRLNIRPKYQREFVYDEKQRVAVISTIRKGFPLNVMYWAVNDDGSYEVLDGQQRTISFCQYAKGEFSIEVDGRPMAMHNLTTPERDKILAYELMVYVCEGNEQDKLDWFKTINIAGEELTPQELRNAVYTGPWLTHAKSIFSKSGGPAHGLSGKYVKGAPLRQELLEKALEWKSKGNVDQYMSDHQNDQNANELWTYFRNVIWWVESTFTVYRKEMKGVDWGPIYDVHSSEALDTEALERRTSELMQDSDVTRKAGIYAYLLNGDARNLSIRKFDDREKRAAYERQKGLCASGKHCHTPGNGEGSKVFLIDEMQGDHITPWSKGGRTVADNCQMLCIPCNRDKSGI